MRLKNFVASAAVAAGCVIGPVQAAGLDGYIAEVVLMQGGRTVAHAFLPVPSDGVIRAGYEDAHPYRRSFSSDPAEGTKTRVEARLTTGLQVEVRCERSEGGLRIGANADLKELHGMDTFGQGNDAIDLPNLNHFAVRDEGPAVARDGGWHFEASSPAKDLTLRVDVRPDRI